MDIYIILKTIYILLSRTDTVCARLIRLITSGRYNHTSIALDSSLTVFYSFARRRLHNPWTAGFIPENVHSGIFGQNGHQPCALYALEIPDEAYARLEAWIDRFYAQFNDYRYNFLGVPLCYFGIPFAREHHYLCSQFVAFMLQLTGACQLPRPVSLMQPMDFAAIPELRLVYSGPLEDVDKNFADVALTG